MFVPRKSIKRVIRHKKLTFMQTRGKRKYNASLNPDSVILHSIQLWYVPGFLAPDRLHPGRYVIPLRLSGIRKHSSAPENRNLIEMQSLASAKNLSIHWCHAMLRFIALFLSPSRVIRGSVAGMGIRYIGSGREGTGVVGRGSVEPHSRMAVMAGSPIGREGGRVMKRPILFCLRYSAGVQYRYRYTYEI